MFFAQNSVASHNPNLRDAQDAAILPVYERLSGQQNREAISICGEKRFDQPGVFINIQGDQLNIFAVLQKIVQLLHGWQFVAARTTPSCPNRLLKQMA
jgi:hypothetical protein